MDLDFGPKATDRVWGELKNRKVSVQQDWNEVEYGKDNLVFSFGDALNRSQSHHFSWSYYLQGFTGPSDL